jgi:tetratricopeptide (TPR) repeat protein
MRTEYFFQITKKPLKRISFESAYAILLCVFGLVLPVSSAYAIGSAAEVVLLIGKGEKSGTEGANWTSAFVNQRLLSGDLVRTLSNSQMALLMADRTQIRLNQNSQLQIKSAVDSSQGLHSVIRLNAGRAWSQARPTKVRANFFGNSSFRITMETKSVTMGIRGTDWDVEVDPEGRTQLTVLSGKVSMDNEQGHIEVGSGEAAVAEVGKAPVKLVLLNPASRVQWVSSWKPQPRRWVAKPDPQLEAAIRNIEAGEYVVALQTLKPLATADVSAAVLAADLLIYQGEIEEAVALLQAHAQNGRGDSLAVGMLAHAWARNDHLADAEKLLQVSLASHPKQIELLLAKGELELLQGYAEPARNTYNAVLKLSPTSAEAWYGLGLIEAERENVRDAKFLLGSALANNPQYSKAAAELAAVQTFAGNLEVSDKLLEDVLAREPENYVALTARGINRLKSKQTKDALEDFMKAGLIEPRYARAWQYSGVAFYQLGESDRALQAFKKAATLDVNDPIPHLLESVLDADALDYGASIAASGEAQERMPYLKSLNQVANSQKGNANLGSSLASFGMEEWATYYSDEAYSPYWAGSHLFRADRYTGKFNKNSELFQGFISDPTVFGASNKNSSLVATPGHYGKLDMVMERHDWQQEALIGTVNGLTAAPVPIAYFASGDVTTGRALHDNSTLRANNYTLGFGVKPRYDLGVFGFATDTSIPTDLRTDTYTDGTLQQDESRSDVGINFKKDPDNQFWLKHGTGKQLNSVSGSFVSQSTADTLKKYYPSVTANGVLDTFQSGIDQADTQFRHAFTSANILWAWGAESSKQTRTGKMVTTFNPVRMNTDEVFSVEATDAYLSASTQAAGKSAAQLDIYSQQVTTKRSEIQSVDILSPASHREIKNTSSELTYNEINPRLGVKWQLGDLHSVRLVGQKWRRSASAGTLSQVDTLGIQLNDSLPMAGGLYERARLQYDAQSGKTAFFQTFVDYERIDNGLGGIRTSVTGFELTQLNSLRNRPDVFTAKADIESTPSFTEGNVASFGIAENVLVNTHQSLSAKYLYRSSRQTGTNDGLLIPYIPRSYLLLGSQWTLADRWLVGTSAAYRSDRFSDDTNKTQIYAGWSFGLTAYWETADKESSVQAILDNLVTDMKSAAGQPYPHLIVRYTLRF